MNWISVAGAAGAIAVLFYCSYTRSYEAVGAIVLLVFFTYFFNLKLGTRGGASLPSPDSSVTPRTPRREVAKSLVCLVVGGLGVGVGSTLPDVQVGVALALTAAVAGIVGFMLFIFRALNA